MTEALRTATSAGPGARPGWLWLSTLGRVLLGAVWLVAGLMKITDLDASVRAVRAYRLLPEVAAQALGAGLPMVEVLLGILLLLGAGIRAGAAISAVLLVAFLIGIGSAWARGLQIDCGCFGSGGQLAAGARPTYGWEMLRDGGLLAVALLLLRWPIGPLSVDGMLCGRREEHDERA